MRDSGASYRSAKGLKIGRQPMSANITNDLKVRASFNSSSLYQEATHWNACPANLHLACDCILLISFHK